MANQIQAILILSMILSLARYQYKIRQAAIRQKKKSLQFGERKVFDYAQRRQEKLSDTVTMDLNRIRAVVHSEKTNDLI